MCAQRVYYFICVYIVNETTACSDAGVCPYLRNILVNNYVEGVRLYLYTVARIDQDKWGALRDRSNGRVKMYYRHPYYILLLHNYERIWECARSVYTSIVNMINL